MSGDRKGEKEMGKDGEGERERREDGKQNLTTKKGEGGGGQKVLEPWPGARHFSVRLPQQDGLVSTDERRCRTRQTRPGTLSCARDGQ